MNAVSHDDFLACLRNLTFAWISNHRLSFLSWFTRQRDMQAALPEGARAEAAVQESWELVEAAWPPVMAHVVRMDPVFANGYGERGTAVLAVPGNEAAQHAAGAVAASLAGPDSTAAGSELMADRNYQPGRVRPVPGQDVWLADVILTPELFPAGGISTGVQLACFFDPQRSPALLLPPLALVHAAMAGSTEVPADWQDAPAPVRRGPPPPPVVPPPLPPAHPPMPRAGVRLPMQPTYVRPVKRKFSVFRVLAGLGIAFALLVFAGSLLFSGRSGGGTSGNPAQDAFRTANSTINTPRDGVAQGNTAAARAAASEFSSTAKTLREAFISKGNRRASKMSKGQFVTWCQESPDAVVFLVHVPELRNYTEDAKEAMGEICYHAARAAVEAHFTSPPAKIFVGVRGALFYDRVVSGKSGPAGEDVEPAVNDESSPEKALYPYFAPPEEKKEPEAVAAPPAK